VQDDIRNAGGTWEDREMVRYRNWVTSRGPQDIPTFNEGMISLFAEQRVGALAGNGQ
jgi:protease I